MSAARAIDIQLFNPVRGIANRMRINPAINFGGMLGPGTTQEQSRAGDERRIDASAAGGIFAIDMEAEVAGFLMGTPFEDDGAIGLREGLEGGDVDGGGGLNGGDGTDGEWVIGDVGTESRSRACDGGDVGGEGSGAESGGGNVDGDDGGAADGKVAKGASHGGGTRAKAYGCGIRVGDIGDLSGERVCDGDILSDGRAGVDDGQDVGEGGAQIDGLRGGGLGCSDTGLGGRSDDGGSRGGIIGGIGIADGARDGGSSGDCGAASDAGIYFDNQGKTDVGTDSRLVVRVHVTVPVPPTAGVVQDQPEGTGVSE